MVIRCPKCGIEYSYGRNICHICENHSIFFGALFKEKHRECQWNCNFKIIPEVAQDNPLISDTIISDTKLPLEDAELMMEEPTSYEWNCDPALRVIQISFFNKKLGYNLIYE